MANRDTITLEALGRSPLPLWAAALLVGQGTAGARVAVGGETLAALAVAAGLALLARRRRLAVAVGLLVAGHLQVAAALRPPADPAHVWHLAPGRLRLCARVVESEEREAGRHRLLLDVEIAAPAGRWRPAGGLVQLTVVDPRRHWPPGTRVEAELSLRRPRNFGNPGEFDYEGYLARRGIHVTAFVLGDGSITEIEAGGRDWVDRWRDDVRRRLAVLGSPSREILGALLLGDLGALPRRVRDEFAAAGVSHVLSISGLHVALVAGVAYAAARWLLARSRQLLLRARVPVLAAAVSLAPVWLYAELARAGIATWRSVSMLALVVAAIVLGRRRDMPASLAAAAIVVSLAWPGAVLDVSFQLSFVAVAALVVGMQLYWSWWRRWSEARLLHLRGGYHRWIAWALASIAVNASALVATAPLTALHFHQVPLVALAANPLVVPLVGTIGVGVGLAGALAALVAPPVAPWLFAVAGITADVGAAIAAWFAALPGAGMRLVAPSPLEIALFYAALGAATVLRGRARRAALGLLALLAVADTAWWVRARYFRPDLGVTFLSVGQGDCTLLEFPGSEVMLIDGGGLYGVDAGERIVGPYLWRRKIARLDYLVLTHPQFDHYGGLAFVARHFAPREFWHNGEVSAAAGYARVRAELVAQRTREERVRAGMAREIGGCRVDVLWPPPVAAGLGVNDASVVLRVECGDASVLLPGDLEAAGEESLRASGALLPTEILKVGHHGSRTSSTAAFLDALGARAAVISAGRDNRFDFPDPAVLGRLAERRTEVYRTDLDGAVTVRAGWDGELRWRRGVGDRPGRSPTAGPDGHQCSWRLTARGPGCDADR